MQTTEPTGDPITSGPDEDDRRAGRVMAVLAVLGLLALLIYFATGMPGMDHGEGDMAGMDMSAPASLTPAAFAARLDDPGVFVVNVHVPDEGAIEGTDATIAYDVIAESDRLPADKDTAVLLYCKTGRMSQQAGRDLLAAGYMDVSHLAGGMDAWTAAGRELTGG